AGFCICARYGFPTATPSTPSHATSTAATTQPMRRGDAVIGIASDASFSELSAIRRTGFVGGGGAGASSTVIVGGGSDGRRGGPISARGGVRAMRGAGGGPGSGVFPVRSIGAVVTARASSARASSIRAGRGARCGALATGGGTAAFAVAGGRIVSIRGRIG